MPEPNKAHQFGKWCRENPFLALLTVVLIGFVCYMIYLFVTCTIDNGEKNSFSKRVSGIMHKNCKSKGGCGSECPHINKNDPRVILHNQVDSIKMMAHNLAEGMKQSASEEEIALAMFEGSKQEEIVNSVKGVLTQTNTSKRRVVESVSQILSAARELDHKFGSADSISLGVVDARNRIAALEAAAALQFNMFIASTMYASGQIMFAQLQVLSQFDKDKIQNYDQKIAETLAHRSKLAERYAELEAKLATTTPTDYVKSLDAVLNPETKTDDVISSMAIMMNSARSSRDMLVDMAGKFEVIAETYKQIISKVESFSNALPATLGSDDMTELISSGDYGTALIKTALEPEVVSNHRKFASERSSFDSGGGVPSVRDDDNDVVKWVGLFGRPTYRRSDGSSADQSSEPLKSIPSDNPQALMRKQTPRLTFR